MHPFHRLAGLVISACIAGCATIPSAGIENTKSLPPDGGILAVQVVTNAALLTDALSNWTDVLVVREGFVGKDGAPEIVSIPALLNGLSTTRVFVGILKPGRYRFVGLSSSTKGENRSYFLAARAPPTIGSFEMQTNHLTNLGTVLFQPFLPDTLATGMIDDSQKIPYAMSRLDDSTSLTNFVSQRFPQQFQRTWGNPQLGWLPDELTSKRQKLANAIRAYAMLSQPHYISDKKEIVYTGHLGTLYKRDGDGAWTTCHVPTNYELLAYNELSNGMFVTGGEHGGVWHSSKGCAAWQAAPLPDRIQNVIWIGAGSSNTIYVLADEKRHYRIYSASANADWAWRLVKEFGKYDPPENLSEPIYSEPPKSFFQRGTKLLLSDSIETYALDTANGTFARTAAEPLFSAITQPDGVIVASPRSAWISVKPPVISTDRGRTWVKYHRLGKFGGLPYIFSNGDALAMNDDIKFVFIGWKKSEKVEVLLSHDKGKTSKIVGHVPYGCGDLQPAISHDDLIFTRCFDGSLLRSADGGKAWITDFSRALRSNSVPQEFYGNGLKTVPR